MVESTAGAMAGLVLPDRAAISALGDMDLIGRYRVAIECLDPRVFELEAEELDRAWLPDAGVGRWSCRAVVCHLFDVEVVYQYRLRRTLAEDRPVFENFDEEAFIDSPLYGMTGRSPGEAAIRMPLGAMVASVHTLRQTMAAALYQLPERDWLREGMHPSRGAMPLRALVAMVTWHFEHHAAYLNAKVERLLGPRPVVEAGGCCGGSGSCACEAEGKAKGSGSCGSGCGCAQG